MPYRVKFSKQAVKFLSKLDPANNALIRSWVRKNLEGTENPRVYGKALQGPLSPYWRYRVTDYRLLAEIQDEKLIIFIAKVGKRDSIYNN
jgi:mRNA interferase RelE/StbE